MAQFRGQLRDRIRGELKSTFGFVDPLRLTQREDVEKAIAHNRELVTSIRNTFHLRYTFTFVAYTSYSLLNTFPGSAQYDTAKLHVL